MFTFDERAHQQLKDDLRARNAVLRDQMFGANGIRPMFTAPAQGTRDANNLAEFTQRMVEYVSNELVRMDYQELTWRRVFSISTDVPPGADVYTKHEVHASGRSAYLGQLGHDFPMVEVGLQPSSRGLLPIGQGWYITQEEILRSTYTRVPISMEKARAADRFVEEHMDRLAWLGDTTVGVQGIIGHTAIPHNDATTGDWSTATAAEIEADILTMINNRRTATGLTGIRWRLVLPIGPYDVLHQTRLSDYVSMTLAQWLLQQLSMYISGFEVSMRLNEASADGDNLGVLIPEGSQYGSALVGQDKSPLGPLQTTLLRQDYGIWSKVGGFWTLKPLLYEIIEGI